MARRRNINFYRSDTDDLYDDSYANYIYDVWMAYNDTAEESGSEYERKCEFVRRLSQLYDHFEIWKIGYMQCYMMEYVRDSQLNSRLLDEFVLIWHDEALKNCTVIPVTADSLEAMQRDIMRAVMR